jgi:hypothetical protein
MYQGRGNQQKIACRQPRWVEPQRHRSRVYRTMMGIRRPIPDPGQSLQSVLFRLTPPVNEQHHRHILWQRTHPAPVGALGRVCLRRTSAPTGLIADVGGRNASLTPTDRDTRASRSRRRRRHG